MQPSAARDFFQELPCHAIQRGIDQVIDARHSCDELVNVVHELAGLDAISIGETKQVVRVQISAVQQGRKKNMCIHRGKVNE